MKFPKFSCFLSFFWFFCFWKKNCHICYLSEICYDCSYPWEKSWCFLVLFYLKDFFWPQYYPTFGHLKKNKEPKNQRRRKWRRRISRKRSPPLNGFSPTFNVFFGTFCWKLSVETSFTIDLEVNLFQFWPKNFTI